MTTSWTNWSGSVTCQPHTSERPASEAELVALINQAREADYTVRVAGTGHSFVPLCASGGMLISLDRLQGLISTDREARRATVWGGTKIHQMGEPLRQAGLAMENMGDIDRQSIAGAISTGTHGTGRGIGNISTQVVGLRFVLASGEVFDCSAETEPEIFKAGQVSLGALGVISQVTLRLLPAYRLHERTWIAPFAACFDQLDELIAGNRHFEFFWLPREDVCAIKTLNPTEAEPQTIGEGQAVSGRLARYMKPERIDHSHLIFPSERNILFNEMEFALPAADGPDCLLEIRQLMREKYPEIAWPLEYRTVGADDIYLSPAYSRETVTISIHQAHNLPYQAFFADAEAIFRNHRGRPHWGKIHSHTAQELGDLYPSWDQFHAVRRRVDPEGRFMNAYLRSLFDCRRCPPG